MKRSIDIFVAVAGLLFFLPVIIVIAALIKWRLGSPVFFRQQRVGLGGRPFVLVKFRTMLQPNTREDESLADALRMTGLGRILRASSLDELPQLYNVLRGEMSVVGPRPLLMEYLPLYTEKQMRRHDVRPGVTGWAQVNGRNSLSWEERFELDVWYVDNHSIWLDCKICLRTLLSVFRRDGISANGEATMSKFRGPGD